MHQLKSRLSTWIKRQDPLHKKYALNVKHSGLRVKGWKKINHINKNPKKLVAVLVIK